MNLLLDDSLAPITSEIGFIEAPATTVADWYRDWDASNQAPHGVEIAQCKVQGDLTAILQALLPLTSIVERRVLFVPTESRWTAFFDNGHRGTDAARTSLIARSLGCRALRVVAIPDSLGTKPAPTKRGRFGASILELYGPTDTSWLNYLRTISLINDGGRWVFESSGTPLPFEDAKVYASPRVKDRLPHEVLDRYLRALGIRAFEAAFYSPDREAILLERRGWHPPAMKELSLEAARADLGLRTETTTISS